MSEKDWIWKTRCPDSGYLVGECACDYCFQEFEMDEVDELEEDDIWNWYEDEDLLENFDYDEWEIDSL